MKLSKSEICIVSSAIEYLYLDKASSFTEKGLKKLSQIQGRLVEEQLPVNAKDIAKIVEEKLLKKFNPLN